MKTTWLGTCDTWLEGEKQLGIVCEDKRGAIDRLVAQDKRSGVHLI